MQLSDDQFHRSLLALRRRGADAAATAAATAAADADAAPPAADDVPPAAEHEAGTVPPDVVQRLLLEPPIRADRVAEVRARLDAGTQPSPTDLADKLVGRLVADRLR